MKQSFTASVRFHRALLIFTLVALFGPLFWALMLSSVQYFSESMLAFDWLVALDFLWLETLGIIALLWVALYYKKLIRRTLWTLALMVLLLGMSLIYAAMTQTLEQGVVHWETLDLLATGGLLIAFNFTLWVLGSYAWLLLEYVRSNPK